MRRRQQHLGPTSSYGRAAVSALLLLLPTNTLALANVPMKIFDSSILREQSWVHRCKVELPTAAGMESLHLAP